MTASPATCRLRPLSAAHVVNRLRDLSPRERLLALVFVAALLFAPVSSAVRLHDTWLPAGDNALIELRARDVATARTPLVGQPSTSGRYGKDRRNANHPGPIEFFLLAPAVRVFGGSAGMLATAAAITGTAVFISAWAVFRQLGRRAGLAAGVALAAVMWTAGGAAMVNPISSSIAGFPLLCSAVLVWCLLCGDVRVFPLACATMSFTAQQHLSVLPSAAVLSVVGAVGLAVSLRRRGVWREVVRDREVRGSLAMGAGVAALCWSPVVYQQLTGHPGNLWMIAHFAGNKPHPAAGVSSALRQLGHTLGLPPFLGRFDITGRMLLAPLSIFTALTAILAAILLTAAAFRWRRTDPRRTALIAVAGGVALAGLVNGSQLPNSIESFRLAFYHWALALSFLELLAVLLVAGDLADRVDLSRRAPLRAVAPIVALALVVVPPAVNLTLSRNVNRIFAPIDKGPINDLVSGILTHRSEIARPPLLLGHGELLFAGLREAVAARLAEEGLDVVHPRSLVGFVHDDRLVDLSTVHSVLVVSVGIGAPDSGISGRPIATANPVPGFDRQALGTLIRQASAGDRVVFGPRLQRAVAALPSQERTRLVRLLRLLKTRPSAALADRAALEHLIKTPLVQPVLGRAELKRVIATLSHLRETTSVATHLSVYLLTPEQLRRSPGLFAQAETPP